MSPCGIRASWVPNDSEDLTLILQCIENCLSQVSETQTTKPWMLASLFMKTTIPFLFTYLKAPMLRL